ncbi:MAG TPA: dihydrolipoamide acetyltransferase family protein [Myxococcales bacterium]|nr:dihydrolipoamide acetyltransferase family protein [Myxococcales bacterium]
MAQFEFKLPDIGEGVVEGEIVKWLVKPGDAVVEDQPLVEVMTDKATVTIPSPRRGKVVQTFGKEGDIAKVHATLVVMELDGGGAAQAQPSAGVPAQGAPTLPAQHAGQPAPLQTAGAPQPEAARSVDRAAGGNGDSRKVLATPVTRRMAREMGVDLASLQGTGPQGRVMKADVLAHAGNRGRPPMQPLQAPLQAPPPRAEPAPADEVRPLRGLRKSIARSMVQSHTYVVPFTFVEECDTGPLTALRERINAGLSARGEAKLSYLPFIAKALLHGFAKYPELNAVMDEEKQALVVRKDVNVAFGAATDAGLTVFVVKDVRGKSIRQIGAEIERLAAAAREQKLQLQDLQGGTFTITSLGRDGGLMATPVVKHPEVAILGVHKIKEWAKPVRHADGSVGVEIAERMNLSCSFDHRVIDGHIGAAFLYEVIRALESPELLLID